MVKTGASVDIALIGFRLGLGKSNVPVLVLVQPLASTTVNIPMPLILIPGK